MKYLETYENFEKDDKTYIAAGNDGTVYDYGDDKVIKYLKTYESHSQIKHKKLYSDILAILGYYSTDDESLRKIADDIYDKYNNDLELYLSFILYSLNLYNMF